MKSKRQVGVVVVSFLFGIVLIINLFFGQHFSIITRNSLITAMAILFYLLVFFSFRQRKKLEKEYQILAEKLESLSLVSGRLYTVFFGFYKQLFVSIQQFIKSETNSSDFTRFFDGLQNERIAVKENHNLIRLMGIADSIIQESGKLIEMFENEKDQILKKFLETAGQKEGENDNREIMLEIQYYSGIIYEFMASIIKDFNDSTEPLSNGVYNIKLRTNDFLENVKKWNKDLTDESSDKNFDKIISKYNYQNDEFKKIFLHLDENYDSLENNLNTIMSRSKTLLENADAINVISDNIRILSINASLESVHAGSFGKGFKIVADEVKRLSATTQSYVKKIIPLIQETNGIITKTLENFEGGRKNIVDKISSQKNEFDIFYDILTNYYQDFNKIFSFISKVITDVNMNIDNLVPIFHLSNLSLQEMENLNKMVQIFLNKHHADIAKSMQSTSEEEKKLIFNSLISAFNKETTTEKELDVINRIFEKMGFEKIDIKRTDKTVEIF
jgi:methyl-accepting chemotaxis protein